MDHCEAMGRSEVAIVFAGCGKPEFFIKKKPLFEVHTETGMLYNTDGGTPMVPIGDPSARTATPYYGVTLDSHWLARVDICDGPSRPSSHHLPAMCRAVPGACHA